MKNFLPIAILVFVSAAILFSCGKDYKTPEDIKGTVAFLDAESALPAFPFGTNTIYMFINADWCKYSKGMRERIFSRPEIIEYMNTHFTCISVMPDSLSVVKFLDEEVTVKEFLEVLKFENYPGHYFFSPTGEIKGVREGYIELRRFKQLLKYMAEGHVDKYNFATFLLKPEARLDTIYGKF